MRLCSGCGSSPRGDVQAECPIPIVGHILWLAASLLEHRRAVRRVCMIPVVRVPESSFTQFTWRRCTCYLIGRCLSAPRSESGRLVAGANGGGFYKRRLRAPASTHDGGCGVRACVCASTVACWAVLNRYLVSASWSGRLCRYLSCKCWGTASAATVYELPTWGRFYRTDACEIHACDGA